MVEDNNTIEWNSMAQILKRLDLITYQINESRFNRDYRKMIDCIGDYYKEISPDLNTEELKVWNDLVLLRIRIYSPNFVGGNSIFPLKQIDEIDIKLRGFAKKHGYLTKNIKDVRKSIVDM